MDRCWYVEHLFLDSQNIISNWRSCQEEYSLQLVSDVEETYLDLEEVNQLAADLVANGDISSAEAAAISAVATCGSIASAVEILSKDRRTVTALFRGACYKIGRYLGGSFTNEGFIEYMKTKYSLSQAELNRLLDVIK